MANRWLICDVSYMAWRSAWAMKDLDLGITFGILRDVFVRRSHYTGFVFAFDFPPYLRASVYPGYKDRDPDPPEKAAMKKVLYKEIRRLREEILPELGYRNVFSQAGYEADDVIAGVVKGMPSEDRAVIVSSDQDLWQLLTPNVEIRAGLNGQSVTFDSFRAEWGIEPSDWSRVKALAGCDGDGVVGIKGIGEKTAAKYVKGLLKQESVAFKLISDNEGMEAKNLPLVKLPWPGLRDFSPREDKATVARWEQVCKGLGMNSLRQLEG